MYEIFTDGKLIFSTKSSNDAYRIINPNLSLDISSAGSFSFTMPPGHPMYSAIQRIRSIVTLKQDGEIIFRGRCTEESVDTYGQKEIYCEGDLAFLRDSIALGEEFRGSLREYFVSRIEKHNKDVEKAKRFVVGDITAANESIKLDIYPGGYTDTHSRIDEVLVKVYGGYLRTRTEGGTTYIDWLKKSGSANKQPIRVGVNLLDLKNQMDAGEIFTILFPIGKTVYTQDGRAGFLAINDINGGSEYIRDEEAIKKYGYIYKHHNFSDIKYPEALKEAAKEYIKSNGELQTLTLKAIDMHLLDSSIERIKPGDFVRIISNPHGIDITIICTKVDADLFNPENTTYTFGEKKQELSSLVQDLKYHDVNPSSPGGGGGTPQQEAEEVMRWAKILVDEANAHINLNAGEINKLENRTSIAEIDIDGLKAEILLRATKEETDKLTGRVSKAEASITVNAEQIKTKVSKDGVISAINQTAESITISASKINLSGYVTASQLAAEIAELSLALSDSITARTLNVTGATTTSTLNATTASISNLRVGGHGISLSSMTVLTGATLQLTATGGVLTGAKLNKSSDTIYYLDWN